MVDFQLFAVYHFLIVSRNVLGRKLEVPNEIQCLERKRIFYLLLLWQYSGKLRGINQSEHTKTSGKRGTTCSPWKAREICSKQPHEKRGKDAVNNSRSGLGFARDWLGWHKLWSDWLECDARVARVSASPRIWLARRKRPLHSPNSLPNTKVLKGGASQF